MQHTLRARRQFKHSNMFSNVITVINNEGTVYPAVLCFSQYYGYMNNGTSQRSKFILVNNILNSKKNDEIL